MNVYSKPLIPEKVLRARVFKEDSFARHCENLHLSCLFAHNLVFVSSKVGCWRVYHDGCYVTKLEHENYNHHAVALKYYKRGRLKFCEGFHLHHPTNRDIYAIARYIARHDRVENTPHRKEVNPMM